MRHLAIAGVLIGIAALLFLMWNDGSPEVGVSRPADFPQETELDHPRDEDTEARLLGESMAQHGPSGRLYFSRIYSDSMVVMQEMEADNQSIEIPATILNMVHSSVDRYVFESGPPETTTAIGYEAGALEFSITRRYDVLLLGGLGGGGMLLFGLVGWLWVRLRREQGEYQRLRTRNRALTEGQEEERKRLAHELHDGPLQALHTAQLYLPEEDNLRDDLTRITNELRAMSAGLHPTTLERFGLAAALREHIEHMEDAGSLDQQPAIHFEADVSDDGLELEEDEQLALFRIGQEAITNALRHAGADQITVRLTGDNGAAELMVEDDGEGFVHQQGQPRGATSLGLVGMQQRADMVDAVLEMQSTPGRGTSVRVRL